MSKFEAFLSKDKNETSVGESKQEGTLRVTEEAQRSLGSSVPVYSESDAVKSLPKFEELFDKLDSDKDFSVTKKDLEKAASNPSLKPHEKEMVDLLKKNYDVVASIGDFSGIDKDTIDRLDTTALDKVVRGGPNWQTGYNYVVAQASEGSARGVEIALATYITSAYLAPAPPVGLAVDIAATLVGGGMIAYEMTKAMGNYDNVKPQLQQLRRDVKELKTD